MIFDYKKISICSCKVIFEYKFVPFILHAMLLSLKCFFSSWSCLFCLGKLSKISELSLKLGVSGWSLLACVLLIVVASKEMQLRITGFCSSLSCLNRSSPKSLLISTVKLEISQNFFKSNHKWYTIVFPRIVENISRV